MAPTLTWLTGFEHGVATPVTSGTGLFDVMTGTALVVNATAKRTGDYGLQVNPVSGAHTSVGKAFVGTTTNVVMRLYIKFATLPSGSTYLAWISPAAADLGIRWDKTSGKFGALVGAGTLQTGGGVVVTGTWYRIDFNAYVGGTTWTVDWSIDGSPQTQATEASHTGGNFANPTRIGSMQSVTLDAYFDDIARSETSGDYPIGVGEVIGLRPNADGTHNNAANIMEDVDGNDIDGATYFAFDKLDENPWVTTANADYVRQTGNGTGNYCEIQFADTTQNNIHGVRAVLQYASATATSNNGKTYVFDSDAQSTTVFSGDMSETSAFYKSVQVATPSGGWTMAYVNSLSARIGYSSDADPDPYWLAMMLEVAYGPAIVSTWTPKVIMI